MMVFRKLAICMGLGTGMFLSIKLTAQERPLPHANSFSIFGTATFANSGFEGQAFNRHLSLLGVHYGRVLARTRMISFSYTPELIPVALLSQPYSNIGDFEVLRNQIPFTHSETSYGLGANLLGFELTFLPTRKIQPIVSTNEGFLYFSRNIPTPNAAQFNLTADIRLGFKIPLRGHKALSLSYMFHHLSNAYSAQQNPGMDSQMICVGYSFNIFGTTHH
jgi:hypothetical protein